MSFWDLPPWGSPARGGPARPYMVLPRGVGTPMSDPKELMENRLGGIVNLTNERALVPIQQAGLNPFVFQTVALLDEDKEEVTGISKLSQGLTGRAAREVIQTEAYQDVMRALEAFHTTAMVSAPEGPEGTATREHHHRMLCALRELASELSRRAIAAAEIEQSLNPGDDDDEDDFE